MVVDKQVEDLKKQIETLIRQIKLLDQKSAKQEREIRSLKNRLTQLEPTVEGLRRRVK